MGEAFRGVARTTAATGAGGVNGWSAREHDSDSVFGVGAAPSCGTLLPMRIGSFFVAAAVLGITAVAAPGCWTNSCLLTICDGPYCRCSVATCGDGAAYDNTIGRCRCKRGRALLGGHCVSPRVATAYCGPGYTYQNGGCYLNQCRPGDELDHGTGLCIPREQVNQVASNIGVNVGAGQKLGCPEGQKLVIDGPSAACVPLAQTCAKDETFDGKACVKRTDECPTGSAWDPGQSKCVEFAKESPSEGLAVNVAQWALANYGPDGGNGNAAFCNAFTRKPWSFGVNEGSTAVVRVAVTTTFPDGQIARGTVQTTATFAASGTPLLPKGAAEVQAAAQAVLAPLVEQGGRAAANIVTTAVKCAVVNAAKPQAVPATGGL